MKYVAQLEHVREVTLRGTADLAFWRERLRREGLIPAESGGRAELLIIAADAVFRGIRFQELSVSVVIDEQAAFLVQAFNSRRFFAFCERVFFRTPYEHGDVRVTSSRAAAIRAPGLSAEMRERRERGAAAAGWDGVVHLPERRLLHARIEGAAEEYAVGPDDRIAATLRPLVDSGFVATRWIIRPDARHAKSKTFRRA